MEKIREKIKGLIGCLMQIVKDLNSTIVYEKT